MGKIKKLVVIPVELEAQLYAAVEKRQPKQLKKKQAKEEVVVEQPQQTVAEKKCRWRMH